jgi:DNA (cytosine-5)-methyltransferase 1
VAADWKNGRPGDGYGPNLPQATTDLMPTPKALDGVKGNLKTSQERLDSGHQVDLPNVAIDLIAEKPVKLFPTLRASDSYERRNQKTMDRIARDGGDMTMTTLARTTTDWGKFEPAIRRWEAILDRPAPEPTKPDGKDNNHRLSSKFTEWMMGLPDGWITDIGLKRNDELKACGNGVVPQQAELALSLLGINDILRGNNE